MTQESKKFKILALKLIGFIAHSGPDLWLITGWSRFQMGSEIRKPNHLKSGQMATIL